MFLLLLHYLVVNWVVLGRKFIECEHFQSQIRTMAFEELLMAMTVPERVEYRKSKKSCCLCFCPAWLMSYQLCIKNHRALTMTIAQKTNGKGHSFVYALFPYCELRGIKIS